MEKRSLELRKDAVEDVPLLVRLGLAHCLAALQLLLLMRVLLLLVDLYVFQCAFLDDLLFVFLGLLECCLVLAVPLQVVHAVLSALVLNTKFPHFSLQVFELMPFLLNWRVSAAFGHVFDGSFYCDFVVVASIEGKVNGEIVFSDGFNSYF